MNLGLQISHFLRGKAESCLEFRGFPGDATGKGSMCQCRLDITDMGWILDQEDPWSKIGQPTPVFLPGESHG